MATTKIQIINLALAYLQQLPVNSFSEEQPPKITALAAMYDVIKIKCLQKTIWSFALKTQRLSRISDVSDYPNYMYMYQLPDDCLTVWQLYVGAYQTQTNYQLIGRRIYSNEPTLWLLYIFPQTENFFTAPFVDYIALQLAAQAGLLFTQDKALAENLLKMAELAFVDASGADGINHPAYVIANYPLITARLSG